MGMMTTLLLAFSVAALLAYPLIRRMGRNAFAIAALVPATAFTFFAIQGPAIFVGKSQSETVNWIPEVGLEITMRLDIVSWLFALLVTGAGAIVLFYCRSYFDDGEEGLARFGSVFLAFAASMLGLVLADNVYLLFLFWEATTVFSFLLIGHAGKQRTSRAAALQALIVTTFGGLVMLVGLVILANSFGTSNLSEIVTAAQTGAGPSGPLVTVSVYLVLVGALSKSAIFPFHFWLPGAMAAPTPVSAYLHAAAMVKAGIYLIARLGPGFSDVPGYREILVILGAITMVNGGVRALRQYDLKLIVAHGTVSQLGLLVMVFGVGDPRTDFAGYAMLFAHAIAKAPLFLAVGIIDHSTGTRDMRKLSGLWRKLPALAVITALATASMIGLPPLLGFVAKESVFTELLTTGSNPLAVLALIVTVLGSILTAAYMMRFYWGAFATKLSTPLCTIVHRDASSNLLAPGLFVGLALLGGAAAPLIDPWLLAASGFPVGAHASPLDGPAHLAIWHGFTPALGASVLVLVVGTLLAWFLIRSPRPMPAVPERLTASHAYWVITHWVDVVAVRLTSITQRGSLPFYLAVIFAMVVGGVGGLLLKDVFIDQTWPRDLSFASTPVQVSIAIVMIAAAIYAIRARTRFQAVVLVGVTGYGMAALFALNGAPDLALTQVLVETVTLIAFVLVIRRLPQHIVLRARRKRRLARAVIGISVGLTIGGVAILALGARVADPISLYLPELAYTGGHGQNVVNVMLVDIRAWDTLGELSVVLAAATGVASLVFLSTRVDNTPKLSRRAARLQVNELIRRVADPNDPEQRGTWLLAGRNLDASRRSILLEVVVRLIFHALILLSFYLLLTGHNTPGGGFTAGLVAGLALVARYLTGGRDELGATVPIDAGRILGSGLALAAAMAITPLFFGQSALSSAWVDLDLGPFGSLPIVSSTLFDIGVYLVVFGLILDVLRSLGSEIDKHEEGDLETSMHETSTEPAERKGAAE